jgi:hypothetical protein
MSGSSGMQPQRDCHQRMQPLHWASSPAHAANARVIAQHESKMKLDSTKIGGAEPKDSLPST